MKKLFSFTALLLSLSLFTGCVQANKNDNPENGVSIVYTNDIHSYIANTITNPETKEVSPALRISKISKMVKDMRKNGQAVILVDDGDEIKGSTYGSIDSGFSIIKIMNKAGYQLATPGNHEFDYGIDRFFFLKSKAKFPYISCNFTNHSSSADKNKMEPFKIFEAAGKKIAFIGITTPETITASTPALFQDENQNYIYEIAGTKNPKDMFLKIQDAIDSVKDKADYIIALGHVGNGLDEQINHISSVDVIENTTGLNAFIDGHSHTTLEQTFIKDKNGNNVLLTQTGAYLNAVGIMNFDKTGNVSAKLVNDYNSADKKVQALEEKLIAKINKYYGTKIAVLENKLYINDPEKENIRIIRALETNLGDLVADSFYWYFNEIMKLDCDLAFQNGGGIRSSIQPGFITENDVKNVSPFENVGCLISATGEQIADALEMGAVNSGIFDKNFNAPAENGGFLHVAGIRYKINTKIPSSLKTDENQMFKEISGKRRVKNIEIYNKLTCSYEPLDFSKRYKIAGINYLLRNSGNGLSMFKDCPLIVDFVCQDCEIISSYLKSFKKENNYPLLKTENSVLSTYKNYQINYENPYGAGRIIIE